MLAFEARMKEEAQARYKDVITSLGDRPETANELIITGAEYAIQRCALHAARLSMVHPSTGEEISFEAPLPTDMVTALACLRSAVALASSRRKASDI